MKNVTRALCALLLALGVAHPQTALAKKGKADPLADLGNDELTESGDDAREDDEDDGLDDQNEDEDDEGDNRDLHTGDDDEAATESAQVDSAAKGGDDAEEEAHPTGTSITVRVSIGGGLGVRGLKTTGRATTQVLKDPAFAAVDLGLQALFSEDEALSFSAQLRYQGSVGLKVSPPGTAQRVGAQSDRAELSFEPMVRLIDSPRSIKLGIAMGGALRGFFHPAKDLPLARFGLFGVLARPQIHVPITDAITLRAGGEVQWFFIVAGVLGEQNAPTQALSYGGELGLTLRLTEWLAIDASYRETLATGLSGGTFEDAERYATARLVGTL